VLSYRFLELTRCQSGTPEYNGKLTNVGRCWPPCLLGSLMVFAADRAFNDLLRNYGKRAVVENPLFD
jgi:hypothetical protein